MAEHGCGSRDPISILAENRVRHQGDRGLVMSKTVRVGMVGAGFAASFHLAAYRRVAEIPVELAGITSRTASKVVALAREFGVQRIYPDLSSMLVDPDIDLVDLPIYDAGNLETSALVDETLQNLYEATKGLLKDGKLPIMLGGEHSLTFAMVKACAEFAGEDFGVLVLDAHFDLREEYRGFKQNHACVSRNILNQVTTNLVSIGIRSGPEEEWVFARENNLKYYTADDV